MIVKQDSIISKPDGIVGAAKQYRDLYLSERDAWGLWFAFEIELETIGCNNLHRLVVLSCRFYIILDAVNLEQLPDCSTVSASFQ